MFLVFKWLVLVLLLYQDTNDLTFPNKFQEQLSDLDGKEDLGRETKKSVIGLGKVLHAAETLNPELTSHVIDHPVKTGFAKPITGSRRDR